MSSQDSHAHDVLIDGSLLEGGGQVRLQCCCVCQSLQVIRISTALASVMNKHISVMKVRASRPKPGLMAQHCTGVKLLAEICAAKTDAQVSRGMPRGDR